MARLAVGLLLGLACTISSEHSQTCAPGEKHTCAVDTELETVVESQFIDPLFDALTFDVCLGVTNQMFGLMQAVMLGDRTGAMVILPKDSPGRVPGSLECFKVGREKPNVTLPLGDVFDLPAFIATMEAQKQGRKLLQNDEVSLSPHITNFTIEMFEAKKPLALVGDHLVSLLPDDLDGRGVVVHVGCPYASIIGRVADTSETPRSPSDIALIEDMWSIIFTIKPAPKLHDLVQLILRDMPPDGFIGIHLRTGEDDWIEKVERNPANNEPVGDCHPLPEHGILGIESAAKRLGRDLSTMAVYVAGVTGWEGQELIDQLENRKVDVFYNDMLIVPEVRDTLSFDQLGIIDQMVLRHSTVFLGNGCSTLSMAIIEYRVRNGHGEDTCVYMNQGSLELPELRDKHLNTVLSHYHML